MINNVNSFSSTYYAFKDLQVPKNHRSVSVVSQQKYHITRESKEESLFTYRSMSS